MAVGSAVDNAAETSGDLNKEAWDKHNLLRSAYLVEHDTDGTHSSTSSVVLKALFDANTILSANADDTPVALTVAASRLIGRASTGNIAALTAAQVNTILSTATKALDNLTAVAINTSLISDTDNTDDLGSAAKEWKDLYIDGTANIDSLVADTADINGGTIGGVTLDGAIAGGDQAFTGVGDMTFTNGSILKSGSSASDTLLLAANDTTCITLTTGTTDKVEFASVNALTAINNLDIGAYTFTCAGLIDDTLTSGRVVLASSGGLLADNGNMTFSTDTLTVKKLVLNDATTATTDMLTLTPSGAVATTATWKGIYIDGDALDPSGDNAAIEGIYVDLSGVAGATGLEMRGVYASVPTGLGYEAVHSIGKIKLDNDESTLAAGETATGIDIIVSASAAGGGEYHAIDVATTGTSSATLAALGTHTGIDVIHQHTGSFIAPTQAWTYDDSGSSYGEVTTAFGSAGTDVTIFPDDDDAIFIGADAVFDEIEVILATKASVDIKPTFFYSKAASFQPFFPADDTEGFTQDGIIRFVGSDLDDFAAQSVNSVSKFYIKIVRTKNNVGTDPIEDTIKTLAATECFWNSTGALQVVSIGAFQATGAIDFNDQNMTSVDIDSGTIGGITFDGALTMSLGSDVDGDIYYRSSNVLTRLAKGTQTYVLTMGASVPEWAAASGGVDTSGSPVANDFARFTDADTIEGREVSEVFSDLGLDTNLADLTTAEVAQLEAIGTTTISAAQWGILGAATEWATWSPSYGATGSMTYTSVSTDIARWARIGKFVYFIMIAHGTTGGSASTGIEFTLPSTPSNGTNSCLGGCMVFDAANIAGSFINSDAAATIGVYKYDGVNWNLAASKYIRVSGFYEVA